MLLGGHQRIWGLVLVGVLMTAPCAWPQLQVGENTTLNANAMASLGYTGVFDGNPLNTVSWGLNGSLSGDYYDPRFLNFTINPYLNQSRLNSNYYSSTAASGLNAVANFLSSSRTPMQFSYERDHNSQGTFNVPGQIGGYQTVGDGQAFGLGASYLPEDWPSLMATYNHSGSSYEIIGVPGTGTSHSNGFGLSSGYQLLGTNLAASFNKSYTDSASPIFGEAGQVTTQNTDQDSFQFSASRRIFNFANLNTTFARSHMQADYRTLETDATFDTVGSSLTMQPTSRLGVNLNMNYSSNLSAQVLSGLLAPGSAAQAPGINGSAVSIAGLHNPTFTSDYLSYGTTASYRVANNFIVTGNISRQIQGQLGGLPDAVSTIMGVAAGWSHRFFGGNFGAHYGISYYFAPLYTRVNETLSSHDSTFTGHNMAVSYSRPVLGWSASTSFSYSRSLTTLLVGYTQTNYSTNGSLSRGIHRWNLAFSGGYSHAHVDSVALSDSDSMSTSASLSHGKYGVSGSYSRSSGSALQIGNSLVPTPVPGLLPNFLVQFGGEGYGFGASYRPLRRWTIDSSYSRVRYHTFNLSVNSNNASDQFYVRSEYGFRQMYFNAGFSHLSQGFGIGSVVPTAINTVYVGVSRRFDFF